MDRASGRQIGVTVLVALLAPAATLAGVLARWGGSWGWVTPLLVLPISLGILWCYSRLGAAGLAPVLRKTVVLPPVYYLWAMALAGLTAGGCVDRLQRTDYAGTPAWVLAVALGGVAAYLIYKGAGSFLRGVEVFYLALFVVVLLFFVLGLGRIRWENLAVGEANWAGVLGGIGPALGALAVGGLAGFLPREGNGPVVRRWVSGWCLVAAGLSLVVVGTLGAAVTAEGPLPFFLALQGMGFQGGFQRLEALGTAAWALSDLALIGLAALAGKELAGGRTWGLWPVIGAAVLGGSVLTDELMAPLAGWFWGANLVLGVGIPVVLALFCPSKN